MAKMEDTEKPMQSENRRADDRYLEKDLATQCLHAGERWEMQSFWTTSTPIHHSTTFFYDSVRDLDDRDLAPVSVRYLVSGIWCQTPVSGARHH